MATVIYSLDNAIDTLFSEAGASSSRAECDEFARQVCGGEVRPNCHQGISSYTVIAGPNCSKIVQFREQAALLDMRSLALAKEIHSNLVASCRELEWTDQQLAVYEMDRPLGENYITAAMSYMRKSIFGGLAYNTFHDLGGACVLSAEILAVETNMIVPGLNAPVTREDLERSRQIYNALPDDSLSHEGTAKHMLPLFDLVSKYALLHVVGFHLLHRHEPLPPETVQFGDIDRPPILRRSKPTSFDRISQHIHGYVFAFNKDFGLIAYEYQAGDPPQISSEQLKPFLQSVDEYIRENRLEDVVALQIYGPSDGREEAWEVPHEEGSYMMAAPAAGARGLKRGKTTGWVGKEKGGKIEISGAQAHIVVNGEKKCYTDGDAQ